MKKGQNKKMVVASKTFQIVVGTMIYIFTLRDSRERILAYKTHFGASVILIKQQKNGTTNNEWKIEQSFLLPVHLLHLFSAKITVDSAKFAFGSDNESDEEEESDYDQSVFDLEAPSPPQLPRQYSFDMMLERMEWQAKECKHPKELSRELRYEFKRLENSLVPLTENQLGTLEYEESLRAYWNVTSSEEEEEEIEEKVASCSNKKTRKRQRRATIESSTTDDE